MKYDVTSDINRDYFRSKLLQYTRKAFKMLPELQKPRILDIGCGTGVVTLELARLSNGRVVGIDTDQAALDKLNVKIEQARLLNRIKTLNCSMRDMRFPDGSFDIIWSEGAIFVIGFEEALNEWRRFIRLEGYLVLHARLGNIEQRVAMIPTLEYRFIDKFVVPKDAWWDDYYGPLERLIEGLRHKYRNDPKAQVILDKAQTEVDEFKSKPEFHGSVFYVMQRTSGG
ncbi:methyltransferase domain-containing protein [candidate division WOR-3 bacterium]|nr:methyltransferase domain-containing protein [candidate division WOR-3 bacterium]